MYENVIGASVGWRKIEYNWRDMALYALAVGADENDLMYTYEKDMKAIPSFGVLPYFSAVNVEPQWPMSYAGCYLAHELIMKELGRTFPIGLHMGHELIMHRPFDPIKGTMVYNDTITKILDRGEGKGLIVETQVPVYDEAGRLICVNNSQSLMSDGGGYGGEAPVKVKVEYPDREPDYVVDSYMSKTQNVLYRLTGDTALVHVDPEEAKRFADRPFMMGLCPFGFACRMMIKAAIPGEPERMTRMSVQMRAVSYPGTPLQLRGWRIAEKKASFKLIDMTSGKAILDNCEFEWD